MFESPVADGQLSETAAVADVMPPLENLYLFGLTANDRDRLNAQGLMFGGYLQDHMPKHLSGFQPRRILDIGCSEGQITRILAGLYPEAEIIGVDVDPDAIARAKAVPMPGHLKRQVEYLVADANNSLPPGPFDLVHSSLTLMYVRDVPQTLKLIYDVLSPGGYVWLRESRNEWLVALPHSATFGRYCAMASVAALRIGMHMFLGQELPHLLPGLGFNDVCSLDQSHPIDGTVHGQIAGTVLLGALYNMRKLIVRMEQLPDELLLAMHREMVVDSRTSGGSWQLSNVVARKPALYGAGD